MTPSRRAGKRAADPLNDPAWQGADSEWGFTHWPNGVELWLEQGFDPSHGPHLHNKVFGFNYKTATPMHMELQGKMGPEGFALQHGGYMKKNQGMQATRSFLAPSVGRFQYDYPDGRSELFIICYTPVSAYESRTFFKTISSRRPPAAFRLLMGGVPKGLLHALPDIGDQDTVIISSQERVMRDEGLSWKDYGLATSADSGVGFVRSWLARFGGGSIPCQQAGPSTSGPVSHEASLDRYERHTKYCPHCQQAVRRIDAAAAVLHGAAMALLLVAAALRPPSIAQLALSPPLLAGLACAAVREVLLSFRKRYYSKGYVSWQQRPWQRGPLQKLVGAGELAVVLLVTAANVVRKAVLGAVGQRKA